MTRSMVTETGSQENALHPWLTGDSGSVCKSGGVLVIKSKDGMFACTKTSFLLSSCTCTSN